MIFKISFKNTPKNPAKATLVVGNKTTVLLNGTVKLPKFFESLPREILDWANSTHYVSGKEDIAEDTLHLKATGHARCHEEDKFDYVFGERLAEARAKYKFYKFFYELTSRLYDYYDRILFGENGIVDVGKGNCLAQDVMKYEALCIREAHHIGELLKSKENG